MPRVATLLGMPGLAAIYLDAAVHRARAAKSPLVLVALLVVSLAGWVATGVPLDARAPTPSRTLGPDAFRPVVPRDVDARGSAPSTVPSPSALAPAPPAATPIATPRPEPPSVIRFRPRDGWTDVSRFADVSVRFTAPMDRIATEAAFQATIGEAALAGRLRWAEADTVLVLSLSTALPYGSAVELSVEGGARSALGVPLAAPARASFVVEPKPRAVPRPTPRPSAWQWPLIGPITQKFGESLTQYGVHQGIDIDGDTGDPVRAARAGRVIVAGYADSCGGLQVRIDHGDGFTSWYRHLSRVSVGVGDRVSGGTLVGRVGATGCATGSHLHFGIRKGSTFVDPLKYLPPR